MSCVQIRPNYFVVVVLPSRQVKRVARPVASNHERCIFVIYLFPGEKYGSMDYKLIICNPWSRINLKLYNFTIDLQL